jgi:hypothetical protein
MRSGSGIAALVLVASVVVACQSRDSAVIWGIRVPTPPPDVVARQPVIEHTGFRITLLPISPRGAQVGVDYLYDMPHCGIQSPIDVDGSFWDAVDVAPDSVDFDGQPGTFRLETSSDAVFTTSTGLVLRLVRHTGTKAFPGCQ